MNARLRRRPKTHSLVDLLASSWSPLLLQLDWPHRLAMLDHIEAQLSDEFGTEVARRASRGFIARFIAQLPHPLLECHDQAAVYRRSADRGQTQAAAAWLALHGWEPAPPMGPGERRAQWRQSLHLAARFHLGAPAVDGGLACGLLDLSRGGARISVPVTLDAGTPAHLAIPYVGELAASVAWSGAALAGLAFS